MTDQVGIGLILLALFVIAFLFHHIWSLRQDRAWRRFAADTGLTFQPSPGGNSLRVFGTYRSHECKLVVFTAQSESFRYSEPELDANSSYDSYGRHDRSQEQFDPGTLIELSVENPSLITFVLTDKGDIFNPIRKSLQKLAGHTVDQMLEGRFDFEIWPDKYTNRLLTACGTKSTWQTLLQLWSPVKLELRYQRLSMRLGYRLSPSHSVVVLRLLADIAQAVEAISRAQVVGLDDQHNPL